ncbi:MAG: FG-GAP-like repeat-containing protein [Ginsengibacter sp.]
MPKRFTALEAISFLLFSVFVFSCTGDKSNNSKQQFSDANISIKRGQELATNYCQSCHLLPDPLLYDSKSWVNEILPSMGPRLGIFEFGNKVYPSNRYDKYLPQGYYPSRPLVNDEQWQNIIDYYTASSPTLLPAQKRNSSIQTGLTLFAVQFPSFQFVDPTTCYVKIDTTVVPHQLWIGDISKKRLYRFDHKLVLIDSLNINGTIVDMQIQRNKIIACDIGILNPTNGKFGKVQNINRDSKDRIRVGSTLFDSLSRPVEIVQVDMNVDGELDYVVCEFGYLGGSLSWYENLGDDKFNRHIIRELPGAIKAYVTDYNHDGLPDLWVLFAQGEEGVFLFTNKGNGRFDQEEVLRFPPSYGSSFFELIDFNNDGFPDILYTCGDNGDYKPILKPYQGVYIFMNDKTNHFKQKYFFPINGCYKAMARDFDGDGDLDIATISFYADYIRQPEEGFVYLENKGDFKFMPFTLSEKKSGRWLTMDAEDIDGDGKCDILLGNYSFWPNTKKPATEWRNEPSFIVLKNTGNKNQVQKNKQKLSMR